MNDSPTKIQPATEEISVAAQISSDQISSLQAQGFQSVINLRSYQEEGASKADRQIAEESGLAYANLPVKPSEISKPVIDQVLQKMDELPKPQLVYCGSALRATLMTLLYLMTYRDMTLESALEKGRSLGVDFDSKPQFKQWLEQYVQAS